MQQSSREDIIERVCAYADAAHGPQQRKYTPERYIVHPVRVMELCRKHSDDLPVLCAALLHDVLEDTPVEPPEMEQFLRTLMNEEEAGRTLKLVIELTDVYIKKDYPQWNRRKRKSAEADRISGTSADAQTIKYADIIDNCKEIVLHDPDFGRLFLRECKGLLQRMKKGDADLYKQARDMVEKGLQALSEKRENKE